LQEQIASAGLDNRITLLGERRDVAEIMLASDFLVLPSLEEGLSNVILEAMALGCPVIASNVGGNPELVEDFATGLLYPSNDHQRLAEAIEKMVASPCLADSLRSQALKTIRERFSVSAMVSSMEDIYRSVAMPPVTTP
jgi:glycosyltransferase involved in cell wall biosynthesis